MLSILFGIPLYITEQFFFCRIQLLRSQMWCISRNILYCQNDSLMCLFCCWAKKKFPKDYKNISRNCSSGLSTKQSYISLVLMQYFSLRVTLPWSRFFHFTTIFCVFCTSFQRLSAPPSLIVSVCVMCMGLCFLVPCVVFLSDTQLE